MSCYWLGFKANVGPDVTSIVNLKIFYQENLVCLTEFLRYLEILAFTNVGVNIYILKNNGMLANIKLQT